MANLVYAPNPRADEVRSFGKCVRLDIIDLCQSGGMADAADSKSVARKGVWVQVPPLVLNFFYSFPQKSRSESENLDILMNPFKSRVLFQSKDLFLVCLVKSLLFD